MNTKTILSRLLPAVLAAGVLLPVCSRATSALFPTLFAEVGVSLHINTPPPPPREVVVIAEPPPPPRHEVIIEERRPSHDHIWVAGYWGWSHDRRVWVEGHWEKPPHARMVWVEPRWEHRGNGYVFIEGRWEEHR